MADTPAWLQFEWFPAGSVLLAQGTVTGKLVVLKEGELEVVRDSKFISSTRSPGAIFGEMSFIEAEVANTAVIAEETCGVMIISHQVVQDIIVQNPGFYGRFFQSLAYLLSQRLRATTGLIGQDPSQWNKVNDV